jgi:hypothetical protein
VYISPGVPVFSPAAFLMAIVNPDDLSPPWSADWAWGLPMIVLTVMFHVTGLGFINPWKTRVMGQKWKYQTLLVGVVTLWIILLHAIEAFLWSTLFVYLEAVPDTPTAVLYSLNALTAYGHTDIKLERQWQLMGALESLNGWILFGLSTAYLFILIQSIWSQNGPAARELPDPKSGEHSSRSFTVSPGFRIHE